MYKLEIGVFEEDKYIYQLDEDGLKCYDEMGMPTITSINNNRKFEIVLSEILPEEDAAKKVRLLLRSKLEKMDNRKVLSVFGHTERDPKTLLIGDGDNYGFRISKL